MSFNSLLFVGFFNLVLIIYWLPLKKFRPIVLLTFSYIFYMSWNFYLLGVIIGISLFTFYMARLIEKNNSLKNKKIYLALSIIICFGILFVFKYLNFLLNDIGGLLDLFNIKHDITLVNIILPVGISFYTFQSISYVIDVYRGQKSEQSFLLYALYISYFPQLVAGPIERSKDLLPQLHEYKKINSEYFINGLPFIISGFIKKVVIADFIAKYVNLIFNDLQNATGACVLIASLLFGIQIYCDFSGYSDIARGCSKMLGIDLSNNFDRPYLSKSINEFWKKWHISLTNWFKDYLYIPLGGNKKGKIRKIVNILIVFSVSGLWHGANITFVIWGLINGILLIIGNILHPLTSKIKSNRLIDIIKIAFTYLIVCLTWIFFRSNSMSDALYCYKLLFTQFGHITDEFNCMNLDISSILIIIIEIIVLYSLAYLPKYNRDKDMIYNCNVTLIYQSFLIMIVVAWIFIYAKGEGSQFIYFQF